MIQLPLGNNMASENTIKELISMGVLYTDETGIHANKPGIYPKQENIPAQTVNQSGEK